jgi:hypothetical protein
MVLLGALFSSFSTSAFLFFSVKTENVLIALLLLVEFFSSSFNDSFASKFFRMNISCDSAEKVGVIKSHFCYLELSLGVLHCCWGLILMLGFVFSSRSISFVNPKHISFGIIFIYLDVAENRTLCFVLTKETLAPIR